MAERPATPPDASADQHARAAYDALAPHYEAFTAHHDYETWTTTLERMARAHRLRGTRGLEAPAATGRSFPRFPDRGYEVTACAIRPAMVESPTAKAGDRARVEVHDIPSLPRLGA